MSNTDLSARISKFIDRKFSKTLDMSEIESHKIRRSHRRLTDVSDSQYIELAI